MPPGGCASATEQNRQTPGDEAAFSLDGVLAEANERQRTHEFCVLVGNTLWSYSDVWAYTKGDPPTVSSEMMPLCVDRVSTF